MKTAKNDKMQKKTSDMNKTSKKKTGKLKKMIIKILCWIIFFCIVGILIVTGINLYMKGCVSQNILTVDEAKELNADCIIVLGAGVRESGKPSWMLEDRIIIGEQLYFNGAASKLLMSGDHGRDNYDEVNTMKSYAIEDGIPSEDIFMDHAGFETYDSIYRAKEIFGAQKVVIVSQKYHLYRALYIAEQLGLDAYGVSSDLRSYSNKQYYRIAREWLARVKSFGKCIVKAEPKYLGDSIDLSGSGDVTNDK